jgi:asparagine synthase (glutamine-hydrolysing)
VPRFVLVVDGSGGWDLPGILARAEGAMTAGGGRERSEKLVRAPFGLLLLGNPAAAPAWIESAGALSFSTSCGDLLAAQAGFLESCREAVRAPERFPLPARPETPQGLQVWGRWDAGAGDLLLVTEANGQRPVFLWHSGPRLVAATEPKGIWAALDGALELDADGLAQLWTLGHCLGPTTLFDGIRCAEPGTAYRFASGRLDARPWDPPRFSEGRSADAEALATRLNRALLDVLAAHRERAPRVAVALSGGMDSRYLLAGAVRTWPGVESFTFGEEGSSDAKLGEAVALRAGVPHRRYVPVDDFLARWAGYAVWRTDGMLGCTHAHGMDAGIAQGAETPHLLNGIGGDHLMGAFLRPSHLVSAADPDRVARFVLSSRRFHARPLEAILKPEILTRVRAPAGEMVRAIAARYSYRRMGNVLLSYWLRHYSSRITVLGPMLEEPWVDFIGPLVDPAFVRVACDIPLELRLLGRLYRRALAQLAPELTRLPWERTGVPPAWPAAAHALGRYGRRLGLLPRSRPTLNHARNFRGVLAPWVRGLLLSPRTLSDGFLEPAYLREIVEEHLSGRSDRTSELSLAITNELWRRMFVEREAIPGQLGA